MPYQGFQKTWISKSTAPNLRGTHKKWNCIQSACTNQYQVFCFCMYIIVFSLNFYGIPECESEWIFDSCDFSWILFLLFVFLAYSDVIVSVLSYYILVCCILLSSLISLLSSNERQNVTWYRRKGEVELSGTGGGKIVVRVYFVRKEPIFLNKIKSMQSILFLKIIIRTQKINSENWFQ